MAGRAAISLTTRPDPGAEMGGTIPLWEWIGDEGATTFSY